MAERAQRGKSVSRRSWAASLLAELAADEVRMIVERPYVEVDGYGAPRVRLC
jgi:hypothetical protein